MTISKEQWEAIESELTGFMPRVQFRYQDREVIVNRVRTGESKHELMVYIDGVIKGCWHFESSKGFDPIVIDLWRKRSKAVCPPKRQAELIKAFGKRKAKEYYPKMYDKTCYYTPAFTTAKSLVRQYKKLKGLEIVKVGYQEITP